MDSMGSSPCLNTGTVRPKSSWGNSVIERGVDGKETGSSDGLQLKQADLSCVHALNEIHLHKIRVVPSKHEADQY
ncbi:hypothetical protein Tco_1574555 [Tanacetum coccineum]